MRRAGGPDGARGAHDLTRPGASQGGPRVLHLGAHPREPMRDPHPVLLPPRGPVTTGAPRAARGAQARRVHGRGAAVAALLAVACGGKPDDTQTEAALPADSAVPDVPDREETGLFFPVDTFDGGGLDEVPNNTLEVRHTGYWDLTPIGGPYDTVIGTLDVDELIDGDTDQPWCYLRYALTGFVVPLDPAGGCDTCDIAFEIEFYLVEDGALLPLPGAEPIDTGGTYDEDDVIEVNGLDECRSPDLPADGERWIMGWSELEETLYLNYYGSDIWLPWYEGALDRDTLSYAWIESFGFVVPEEEE